MQKEDIIDWQDLAPLDNHLTGPMKESLRDKHYASDEELKISVMKWLKRAVNKILRGSDACSHSKVKHCY